MPPGSLESARLAFKRAFLCYYLELSSPVIADPTEAFATCRSYLRLLHERLGDEEFHRRLDDEATRLAGQLDQELRQRFKDRLPRPSYDDVEDRLRECFDHGLAGLPGAAPEFPVE